MNYALTFICIFCSCSCWYVFKRFYDTLKKIDEEQLRKIWEADLYEDKKDDIN